MGDDKHREANRRGLESAGQLGLGRDAYCRRAWEDAYRLFSIADSKAPLGVEDLERLAVSAYLTGRDEAYARSLTRAHHAYLDRGDPVRAARTAFWLGLHLMLGGESGPASGWFGRAGRLLQQEGRACVEEGYLLLPASERQLRGGDAATAYATAVRAAEIGDRFAEADLGACARHVQGRALIQEGQLEKGLALLDEAMVAVTSGELSPIMTGLIYCSVVDACRQIYAVDRAREWTAALAEWCAGQPQMVSFTGTCLVHRAELMQTNGAWQVSIEEARRACEVLSGGSMQRAAAEALYQQGEIHRLRGHFREAEEAYRQASRYGYEPLPGLALLRLAQGRTKAAAAAISRAVSATPDRLQRMKLLPAHVEVTLAAGDVEAARAACSELEAGASHFQSAMLKAMAAQATGAAHLATGNPQAALPTLRRAFRLWSQVKAPYFAARTRELIGIACRALEDEESAVLELGAAREAYSELGAAPDLARIDSSIAVASPPQAFGLTGRELQVLRMVATGKPNKAIAAELCLSEKTVDRHLSNIFNKLDVHSRTAATALAYEYKLV